MNEHETSFDIIEEMRGAKTEFPFVYLIGEPDTPEIKDFRTNEITEPRKINIHRVTVKELADRLEAAHKRELGNCAKMREALKATLDLFWYIHNANRSPQSNQAYAVIKQIKAAIAASPRNCDALSAQEQTEKFNQFCQSHRNSDLPRCAGCPLEDIPDGTGCAQAWAQMPYVEKEGGDK